MVSVNNGYNDCVGTQQVYHAFQLRLQGKEIATMRMHAQALTALHVQV